MSFDSNTWYQVVSRATGNALNTGSFDSGHDVASFNASSKPASGADQLFQFLSPNNAYGSYIVRPQAYGLNYQGNDWEHYQGCTFFKKPKTFHLFFTSFLCAAQKEEEEGVKQDL